MHPEVFADEDVKEETCDVKLVSSYIYIYICNYSVTCYVWLDKIKPRSFSGSIMLRAMAAGFSVALDGRVFGGSLFGTSLNVSFVLTSASLLVASCYS